MIPFEIAPKANLDLDSIWTYYALELGDANLGEKLNEEIFKAIRKLARMPELGHYRTDLAPKPMQFYRVKQFMIAYVVREGTLEIARIIHGARDFQEME